MGIICTCARTDSEQDNLTYASQSQSVTDVVYDSVIILLFVCLFARMYNVIKTRCYRGVSVADEESLPRGFLAVKKNNGCDPRRRVRPPLLL